MAMRCPSQPGTKHRPEAGGDGGQHRRPGEIAIPNISTVLREKRESSSRWQPADPQAQSKDRGEKTDS